MAIEMADGPAGRRAVLAGHGVDVWEAIETLRAAGNSVPRAARYLDVPEAALREAIAWRETHRAEVDGWIADAHALAETAESAWRREQWGGAP